MSADYSDWVFDQDVKIHISVEVNDMPVFESEYYSVDGLEEDLRKPERAIEAELESQFEQITADPDDD